MEVGLVGPRLQGFSPFIDANIQSLTAIGTKGVILGHSCSTCLAISASLVAEEVAMSVAVEEDGVC